MVNMGFGFQQTVFRQQNYMEAFKSISKIFSSIEEIPKNANNNQIITEFKRKIKEFINDVTNEVWEMIDKYEKQITLLKQENRRLKEGNYQSKHASTNYKPSVVNQREETTPSNPRSRKNNNLDFIPTTKSNLFTPFAKSPQDDAKFTAILASYKKGDDDDHFPMEYINQQIDINGKSIFEIRAQHKKQRQEQLRNFLQTGRKSLNHTTERYLSSIGKQKKVEQRSQHAEVHRDHSDSSISLRRKDSGLNQSLGDVCNNLDNSIIARRAKSSKKKRSSQFEQEARRKQKHEEDMEKMMKNKGVKNLLLRLRENVESSPTKAPEIIQSSKLISCGPPKSLSKQIEYSSSKNSSKVLINPVPVDVVRKSQVIKKEKLQNLNISPIKAQQNTSKDVSSPVKSILKQTSNILTKSMSGND